MDLYNNFIALITEIEVTELILAAYGLLLLATSFIKSSYGLYSFTGALALSCSIAVRLLGGGNIAQAFIMLFVMLFLITLFFLLSMRFSKYGWILRMPSSRIDKGIKEIRLPRGKK